MDPSQIAARIVALPNTILSLLAAELARPGAAPDDRPLLSVFQTAERLGVKERTVRELIAWGDDGNPPRLASIIVGNGARRIEPREVDRYIERQRMLAAEPVRGGDASSGKPLSGARQTS
jgi:hypothetical protein